MKRDTNANLNTSILELILSRRTVHSYLSEKIPTEIIEKAVLAGIHAPNHKMTCPWRFYWLGAEARKKLATQNPKFSSPGEIIVLCIKKSNDATQAREDYASLACAVQNMSLYFASVGYGSKWSTGKMSREDQLINLITETQKEHDQNEPLEFCGVLWVGRADDKDLLTKKPTRPEVTKFLVKIN